MWAPCSGSVSLRTAVAQPAPKDCWDLSAVSLLHTAMGQGGTSQPRDIPGAGVTQTLVQQDKTWDSEIKNKCFQKQSRNKNCYNPAHTFTVIKWDGELGDTSAAILFPAPALEYPTGCHCWHSRMAQWGMWMLCFPRKVPSFCIHARI